MKQEELMIGDYVQVNDEVCKVISISYFDIGISDSKEDFYNEHIDNIKPIPLTPEILEKNGFEECHIKEIEYFGWRLNEDFSLELNAIDTITWNDNVPIYSVHQLQHALRLCGINKEIKL